jgi:hypothetical protein
VSLPAYCNSRRFFIGCGESAYSHILPVAIVAIQSSRISFFCRQQMAMSLTIIYYPIATVASRVPPKYSFFASMGVNIFFHRQSGDVSPLLLPLAHVRVFCASVSLRVDLCVRVWPCVCLPINIPVLLPTGRQCATDGGPSPSSWVRTPFGLLLSQLGARWCVFRPLPFRRVSFRRAGS